MAAPLRPALVALIEALARRAVQDYLTAQAEARRAFGEVVTNRPLLLSPPVAA